MERVEKAQKSLEALPQPPARFTMTEWYLNNRQRYRQAEDQQHLAERILSECDRVRDEVTLLFTYSISTSVF